MAGRDRLFAGCRCGNKELSIAEVTDKLGFLDLKRPCAKCLLMPEWWMEKEPDWPNLLRGL